MLFVEKGDTIKIIVPDNEQGEVKSKDDSGWGDDAEKKCKNLCLGGGIDHGHKV